MNEARDRMQSKLLAGSNATSRLVDGVHNPCLPGMSRQEVRLDIHYDDAGRETWDPSSGVTENGFYQGILKNDGPKGDFESCMEHTKQLLHLEDNQWCNFAHRRDCSFNGVYMPEMPHQSEHFGEFLAISNYYHVWDFLNLPTRASLQELHNKTEYICNMDQDELLQFNKDNARVPKGDVDDYCFRSSYVFNMLHHGYGFGLDEFITATDVLKGQKIGWALGAMLYEINTFPWKYNEHEPKDQNPLTKTLGKGGTVPQLETFFLVMVLIGIVVATIGSFVVRSKRKNREQYLALK
jgi:GDA1/CD39 (nucleoside phosphatase) family